MPTTITHVWCGRKRYNSATTSDWKSSLQIGVPFARPRSRTEPSHAHTANVQYAEGGS